MPAGALYRADPRFAALGPEFADPVTPAAFPEQTLCFRNDRAAASVGLDGLTDLEWLDAFARFKPLPRNQPQPLAMRYHGHQFRTYNPDLGDGRGFLYAQLREAGTDRLLDLGAKGSGKTPWSRTADGRLTLKGGVREVLAAEMLEALGVPTSRAFSLIETGESLTRGDEPSPTRSAVLTRLSHSHIRFGTFQRLAYIERPDLLEILIGHALEAYHPDRQGAAGLLAAAVDRTAALTARWMAAGFVHGGLNTDNMNITGESFDYGPWRFLPRSDPAFTAAYFDHSGLYAFGRQPDAAFWNLRQLAASLTPVAGQDELIEILNGFETAYVRELVAAMLRRLGVKPQGAEADATLVSAAFKALAAGGEGLGWEPFFFDWFCGPASVGRAALSPRAAIYAGEEGRAFSDLILAREPERPERLADSYFGRAGPETMLIDEVEAIWAPIAANDDWSAFNAKVLAVRGAGRAWNLDV